MKNIYLSLTLLLLCFSSITALSKDDETYSPENSIEHINKAFDKTSLVVFGESHDALELYDFYVSLVSNSEFQKKVSVIVFEVLTEEHQNILDRYILDGENLDYSTVALAWRDVTGLPLSDGDPAKSLMFRLLNTIRKVNLNLSSEHKIRVVGADTPVYWDTLKSTKDYWPSVGRRDLNMLTATWKNVVDKKKNAFIILGRSRASRSDPKPENWLSQVDILERRIGKPAYIIRAWHTKHGALTTKNNGYGIIPVENTDLAKISVERLHMLHLIYRVN